MLHDLTFNYTSHSIQHNTRSLGSLLFSFFFFFFVRAVLDTRWMLLYDTPPPSVVRFVCQKAIKQYSIYLLPLRRPA